MNLNRRIVLFSFLIILEIISVQSSLSLLVEFVPRKLFVQRKLVKQKLNYITFYLIIFNLFHKSKISFLSYKVLNNTNQNGT